MTRRPCFFDLETGPDEQKLEKEGIEQIAFVDLGCLTTEKTVKSYLGETFKCLSDEQFQELIDEEMAGKERAGVLAAINTAKGNKDKFFKQFYVTPELNRILSAAWAFGMDDPESAMVGADNTEKELLEHLWDLILRANFLIGYNIHGFDIPTIVTRSAYLNVKPSRFIDLQAYSNPEIIDLQAIRYGRHVNGSTKGLKTLTHWFGLEEGLDETEGVDGSQAYRLWSEDPDKLLLYNEHDVIRTQRLYNFWSGYYLQPVPMDGEAPVSGTTDTGY